MEMGYSISPASLRLDDLTESIVGKLHASGERSITIAPETGSDRLRRVINKTVTNAEILEKTDLIFASGIDNLKLYYMIGLPTETDDDLEAIRELTGQMRDIMMGHARPKGRVGRIVASVNPLIPKPGHGLPVAADGGSRRSPIARASGCARSWPISTTSTSTSSRSGTPTTRRCMSLGDRRVAPAIEAAERNGGNWRAAVAESRRRRRLLHLPRPLGRRDAAVGHHRRRHEVVVLPRGVRQGPPRGVDAAPEALVREQEVPAGAYVDLRPAENLRPRYAVASTAAPACSS